MSFRTVIVPLLILILCIALVPVRATAQTYELQRLILDIQKLDALKKLLQDLYKGYTILETGYSKVKDLSKGSFTLHEAFLDGLWLVSPTVRKYPLVQRTLDNQWAIVTACVQSRKRFTDNPLLNPEEGLYLTSVYGRMLDVSAANVEQLMRILTPRTFRMNDAERLTAIDGLYKTSTDQLVFVRRVSSTTAVLLANRKDESGNNGSMERLYGTP